MEIGVGSAGASAARRRRQRLAAEYQKRTQPLLRRYFSDVRLEWPVAKEATDAFSPDVRRYAPRLDIAVGPFNTTLGSDSDISEDLLRPEALHAAFDQRSPNRNARCLLAIEVVYSGSMKHMMGDILNASAIGLYGLVLGGEKAMPRLERILRYLEQLAQLEKLPYRFQNVVVLSTTSSMNFRT